MGEDFIDNVRQLDAARNTATPPPAINGTNNGDTPYALAALRGDIERLTAASEGTRNDTLNSVAYNLAGFVRAGELNQALAIDHLERAALNSGLTRTEIDATIRSAFNGADTKNKIRTTPPRTTTNGHQSPPPLNGVETPEIDPIWGSHTPIAATHYLAGADTTTALWGHHDDILWAESEALMIAGGMGLGKTTLAGQLVRAQLGLDTHVLGLPVTPTAGPILYLAMDRPRQIRRSMLRQFDIITEQQQLANLLIRIGPPIADLAVRPTLLLEMAQACNAAVVYIDSLKDAAIGLSSDEVGAAYNRARQHLLADDRQLCELHHLIKRNPHGGQPNSLADVYGSNWLTAGAGSVIILTGDPGDPIVGFRHAKQPFNEVGPWRLMHNQNCGQFTIDHQVDILLYAKTAGSRGLTPQAIAGAMFEKDKPTRSQIEKARRRLEKLTEMGQLVRVEGLKGGGDDRNPTKYFLPE